MARPIYTAPVASGARTATGSSAVVPVPSTAESISFLANVTAVSGTTPSMTLTVEWTNDGTTFASSDPVDTFTAITAVSAKVKTFAVRGSACRLTWTISGTTPSFTFDVSATVTGASLG